MDCPLQFKPPVFNGVHVRRLTCPLKNVDECLGLLSCWKSHFQPSVSLLAEATRFCPSQSPHFNPIEHLWFELKSTVKGYQGSGKILYGGMVMIPRNVFSNLIKHFRKRLGVVILGRGGCWNTENTGTNNFDPCLF
jgi:hypothetical protein